MSCALFLCINYLFVKEPFLTTYGEKSCSSVRERSLIAMESFEKNSTRQT